MNGHRQFACVILISLLLVTACGGGGSTVAGGGTQPTKSAVKISTTGALPSGTLIGGIDITVSLAPGVSARSTTNPPETDAGVVVASGVASSNSTILATYTSASGATPAKARLLVVNTSGFGIGEFAIVNGDIAAGNSPQAADFTVASITVTDLNGSPISGLTSAFTVNNQ
ncbi:MAG: hypothetical protein M0R70_13150 [Nitrospirae bacterium]|nr:hypothetical protein [Nitrospirota bacterium]